MGWIRCVRCKNVRGDFVSQTLALIETARPVLHRVLCSYEMITNAPKHYKTHKNLSLRSNGLDRVHCEKFHRNFMVQTFALTAPVQPSLHQVLCCNETIQNAPELHETHQNLRLWSNGVDRVHSLWKIPTRLRGTNFFTNCTSSVQIALCFVQNDSKRTQTLRNSPKHEFRV